MEVTVIICLKLFQRSVDFLIFFVNWNYYKTCHYEVKELILSGDIVLKFSMLGNIYEYQHCTHKSIQEEIWEFVSCAYAVPATGCFPRKPERKRGVCRLTQQHTHLVPTQEQAFRNPPPQEQANGNDYKFTRFHQSDLPS